MQSQDVDTWANAQNRMAETIGMWQSRMQFFDMGAYEQSNEGDFHNVGLISIFSL